MKTKPVRFSVKNLERLGKTGTSEDTADSALEKLLDLEEDVNRVLMWGEGPKTEKLKQLIEKIRKTRRKGGSAD